MSIKSTEINCNMCRLHAEKNTKLHQILLLLLLIFGVVVVVVGYQYISSCIHRLYSFVTHIIFFCSFVCFCCCCCCLDDIKMMSWVKKKIIVIIYRIRKKTMHMTLSDLSTHYFFHLINSNFTLRYSYVPIHTNY